MSVIMWSPVKHIALLCVVLVITHKTLSMEKETDQDILSKVNFPQRALQQYQNLITIAQVEKRDCAHNHTLRYEILKKSIDYHWKTCMKTIPNHNVHQLLVCMEDRTLADLDILLHDIIDLTECIGKKENTTEVSEADWAKQMTEVKTNLPAVKKGNEFYVAVENAKLAHRANCYNEFWPLVGEFMSNIDLAIGNCQRFVPKGRVEEFKQCCNDLTQPILSDIESKLMYVGSCGT